MTPEVTRSVHRTAIGSAVIGAVLSPIPLLDELVLFPVYGGLALRIGRAHGLAFGSVPWRPLMRTAVNGLFARAGLNLAVSYIPGVAAVANAASAAVLTEAFGRFADTACEHPAEAKPVRVREMAELLRARIANWRSSGAPRSA